MNALLALSHRIDGLSHSVGQGVTWAALAMVLLSAVNAFAHELCSVGSDASLGVKRRRPPLRRHLGPGHRTSVDLGGRRWPDRAGAGG